VERLKNLGPDDVATIYSGQFEGDIALLPEQWDQLLGKNGKTAILNKAMYWTDNIVPYYIREEDFSKN
jgi:hypothetical protein